LAHCVPAAPSDSYETRLAQETQHGCIEGFRLVDVGGVAGVGDDLSRFQPRTGTNELRI
jgi:hypothetical protein